MDTPKELVHIIDQLVHGGPRAPKRDPEPGEKDGMLHFAGRVISNIPRDTSPSTMRIWSNEECALLGNRLRTLRYRAAHLYCQETELDRVTFDKIRSSLFAEGLYQSMIGVPAEIPARSEIMPDLVLTTDPKIVKRIGPARLFQGIWITDLSEEAPHGWVKLPGNISCEVGGDLEWILRRKWWEMRRKLV